MMTALITWLFIATAVAAGVALGRVVDRALRAEAERQVWRGRTTSYATRDPMRAVLSREKRRAHLVERSAFDAEVTRLEAERRKAANGSA